METWATKLFSAKIGGTQTSKRLTHPVFWICLWMDSNRLRTSANYSVIWGGVSFQMCTELDLICGTSLKETSHQYAAIVERISPAYTIPVIYTALGVFLWSPQCVLWPSAVLSIILFAHVYVAFCLCRLSGLATSSRSPSNPVFGALWFILPLIQYIPPTN